MGYAAYVVVGLTRKTVDVDAKVNFDMQTAIKNQSDKKMMKLMTIMKTSKQNLSDKFSRNC
jgi:hypothetical protein